MMTANSEHQSPESVERITPLPLSVLSRLGLTTMKVSREVTPSTALQNRA